MFAVMTTAAVTLGGHDPIQVDTAQQAAQSLRPLAGALAGLLFAAGIVGTGLLAVPVLAGSTAYALAETAGWPEGWAGASGRPAPSMPCSPSRSCLGGDGLDRDQPDPGVVPGGDLQRRDRAEAAAWSPPWASPSSMPRIAPMEVDVAPAGGPRRSRLVGRAGFQLAGVDNGCWW
jgi:Natural resistance-associated macrophage protein